MKPMAGNFDVWLGSLTDVESFLVVTSPEEVAALSVSTMIHYIDPRVLASWVRDIMGDIELATALEAVMDSGRPYGLLVPELKQLIAERLSQCEAVLTGQPTQ